MAGRKEFELLFKLQASLGNNFKSSFTDAKTATKDLQGTIKNLKDTAGDINKFKIQEKQLKASKTAAENNKKELEALKKEYKETGGESDRLKQRIQQKEVALARSEEKVRKESESLKQLKDNLDKAGISTTNLSAEHEKLSGSIDKAVLKQEKLAKIAAAQEQNKKAIAGTKRELAGAIGVATAVGAAIIAGPVKGAMEYESAMADVAKVVDGLKDGSGNFTKEYHEMKKEILDLTTVIPMTSKELTEIAAAAGQAGLARGEITKFTTDAAKMGIAFDTTADQAGEWMAKWRTSFGLTQEQVVELADKINYLGDTSAAEAQQIAGIVTKVGPLGEVAGFANGEIAALGATLIATGVAEDVAATGIKKLMTTMTAGTATTEKQQGVLSSLGISSEELAKRMQVDATGAVMDFMGALNKLPKAQQAAALKDYFGQESIGALAPLLTNLNLLEEQFIKVGDASNYAGSMEEEYATRSATTENKIILAKNSIGKLSRVLGDTFLPAIGKGAAKLTELVSGVADFAHRNPELISTIAKVAGALLVAKVGALGLKLGFLQLKGGFLGIKAAITTLQGLKFAEGLKKMTGLMGGMKAKVLPIIAIITALVVIIKLISGNLEEIREKIKNTFGDGALAVFDKVVAVFRNVAEEAKKIVGNETFQKVKQFFESFGAGTPIMETIKNAIKGLMDILPVIIDNLVQIAQGVLPIIMSFISGIIPIMGILINSILPVVIELITNILPILQNIASMVLPVLTEAIKFVANIIGFLVENGLPLLKGLLEFLIPIITALAGVFTSVLQAALQNVRNRIEAFTQTLGGIIDFITGVFTGNWQKAWQGLQDIVGGVFKGLITKVTGPLNLIIGAVNGVIKGLNKVKLPDWVPGIGGKGINIPTIPMLAKGSNNSPNTFIAGEEGPELITGAPGRKVFTALETGNIFGNIKQAVSAAKGVTLGGLGTPRQELAIAGAPGVSYSNKSDKIIKIEHKPVFHVTNGDPKEIEEALKKSNEDLKREIKDELREEREDERRTKYD